jgi:hypothetical protein
LNQELDFMLLDPVMIVIRRANLTTKANLERNAEDLNNFIGRLSGEPLLLQIASEHLKPPVA